MVQGAFTARGAMVGCAYCVKLEPPTSVTPQRFLLYLLYSGSSQVKPPFERSLVVRCSPSSATRSSLAFKRLRYRHHHHRHRRCCPQLPSCARHTTSQHTYAPVSEQRTLKLHSTRLDSYFRLRNSAPSTPRPHPSAWVSIGSCPFREGGRRLQQNSNGRKLLLRPFL